MEVTTYRFDHDLILFNLGDVHRGDPQCNVALLHKVIETIRRNDRAYWISTGDLLNVALKTSLSDVYSSMSLERELDLFCQEIEPIVGQCLGFVASNHHTRFDKAVGMSLDRLIARNLKIPFLGASGLINVTLGRAVYYIALHHGTGGGKMRGSKTNNLERLELIYPGCDLYLEGHTHAFDFFINEETYLDRKRNALVRYPAYFCTTGHFLTWDGSYAEGMKLRPAQNGAAVLRLKYAGAGNFSKKKISGDLFF